MKVKIRFCYSVWRLIAVAIVAAMTVTASTGYAAVETYNLSLTDREIDVRNGAVVKVNADDYFILRDAGSPELPYRVVGVLLPQGHVVESFDIISSGRTKLAQDYSPVLAAPQVTDDGIEGAARPIVEWSSDSRRFPSSSVVHLGTGFYHGYTIASFAVFPIQLVDGDLVRLEDVALELSTRAAEEGQLSAVTRERYREGFRDGIAAQIGSMVVNPEAASEYHFTETRVTKERRGFHPTSYPSLEGSEVDYVIITNDSLAAAYQTLADWKTIKGVPTVIRTTEWIEANYRNGSDLQETMRNFIVDAYAKWGVTYVLLGGDTDQVPARLVWSAYYDGGRFLPVDLYYAGLDGDWNADGDNIFGEQPPSGNDFPDLYAEVYTGRLPTRNNADVSLLTSKIIDYETPDDHFFTNRVLFLAEVLFWSGAAISLDGAVFTEYVHQSFMQDPGLDVVRMYENYTPFPGAVPLSKQAALDSLEVGFDHTIHVGHGFRFNMSVGDASILNSDADVLGNAPRYTNIYLLNCTAVAYTYFCLAEHYLLAPNGGAVTAVGANESAFPNASSWYMNDYYDLLFMKGKVHIGEAFHRSREGQTPSALVSDNVHLWTHYIYTLLADPEMSLWTNVVDTLDVSHVASVGLGTSSITVTVLDGGVPVDSAMVCLSKGTDDYQYGSTDGAGEATFDFRAESTGQIRVVVTGLNHGRYDGFVTVNGSSGAYVSLNGVTVDDDNAGGTAGNGDGAIDAGETVDLWLEMINSGGAASGSVSLVLRNGGGGVTIADSLATVGVVGGNGGTGTATDAVRITFASSITDQTPADFELIIEEDGTPTWNDTFSRVVHAPTLNLVTLRIDDSAFGNGDGVVQAGELFDLYYTLKDFGTGAAYGLTAELADLDDAFVFTDSLDDYSDILSMTEAENNGGFRITETVVSTEHYLEITVTDAWGRAYVDTFELRRPDPPSNLSFDPSLGVDRLAVTWDASVSADIWAYNVYRSDFQGGPYSLVNTDPVVHTLFLDTGLSANTRYYYVVTGIDSSGNESSPSAEGSASTNPPQMPNFPIIMKSPTSSSTVVGDIDGDGDLEIVQANENVLAWHHNGLEIVDGDDDPQTWGVLNTEEGEFVSSIALAALDNSTRGLEIVAASRDSMKVYVFDGAGDIMPGWPKRVENKVRAAMVVGDINNDNVLEIIVLDELGVLYAWEPDGNEYRDGDSNPGTDGVFFRFTGCSYQYGPPAVADIDMDGLKEIVVATQGDEVHVLNEDGTEVTGWPVGIPSDGVGGVVVGDIDNSGGGDLEIVVNTKNGDFFAFHHDGSELWSKWFPNSQLFAPSPALADLNGDGDLEAICPSSNGNLYAIQSDGSHLPGWPVQYSATTYSESSPVIADIDGDGGLDVLLGDETKLIKAWDASGNLLDGFPLATNDAMRAVPTVVDIDFDSDVDVIAAGWDQNIYVWDCDGNYDQNKMPSPSYQNNRHNDGLYGSVIPTAVAGVSFSSQAMPGGGVSLTWYLPARAGYMFDIRRASAPRSGSTEAGVYTTVASGSAVGTGGELSFFDNGARVGERYVYQVVASEGDEVIHTTGTIYVPVTQGSLSQNYPNPFNPTTTISYLVPDGVAQRVRLVVYDVSGARVRTLVDREQAGGSYTVDWDGRNDNGQAVGSGLYFYRLVERNYTQTKKMLLLK